MTDITELVQRLKLEVHRAVSDFNPQMNIKTRDLKELVEALEKTKAKADIYDMLRDDYGLREKGVGLTCFVDWQAKRIAELESRTVKLPQRLQPGADGWDDWYVHSDDEGEYLKFDDVLAMLTAAGIKVEAE
ncbi:hypothetical protein R2E44_005059 [Klebsiella pneumoniae]|uniref:hypothetical protein n=1 Tax=Klebsiella pneumoniae complex TaxID=3390273 RepID=UPI000DE5ED4D|nr:MULTISPECIES: hypothetical protein [Klebsiella]ELQ0697098.1 hypothetical protein [Klebsiella pneumoniae]ELT5799502.1 hypothetical protein [Klebsiella pneumoniae]EMA2497831.1 hypothetical protein [Klebsiella pneumoniae]MBD7651681.1 hypothetical protein [Klebsiella pneumoniae]MCE0144709.1 hypothetical protein [Klebsiella pneumoniae]